MSTTSIARTLQAPLSPSGLDGIHRSWSAANDLSVGQIDPASTRDWTWPSCDGAKPQPALAR